MNEKLENNLEHRIEKEKLSAMADMAEKVCHDIRNPLAAIKNGIYFLEYSVKSENPRVKATIEIVNNEIDHIGNMLDDLLGFYKQDSPTFKLVNVNLLICEVLSALNIPENIEIVKKLEENLPKYNIAFNEIRQVFVNIISNAWQACDKDGSIIEITTKQEENKDLYIGIRDNGIGIPQDNLGEVFDVFYSTKNGVMGLGLSAAKKNVNRHAGRIMIKSTVDVGTEIIIIIPQIAEFR